MQRRWAAIRTRVSLYWWIYIWAVASFVGIAALRHDGRFWGVDFTVFFVFNTIAGFIYVFLADIVPPFWWLLTLPWWLRSRPLAAAFVVTAIALWLALLLVVIPNYYGPSGRLVGASVSVVGVIVLYRFAQYRRRR